METLSKVIIKILNQLNQQNSLQVNYYLTNNNRENSSVKELEDVRKKLKFAKKLRKEMSTISFRLFKKYILRGGSFTL